MGLGTKLVLGGAAVAALAFLALTVRPGGPDIDGEPLPATPVDVAFRPETDARRRERPERPEETSVDADHADPATADPADGPERRPPALLSGRVIDEGGRPLAGVRVRGENDRALDLTTAADGRIDAPYPVAMGMRSIALTFTATGRATVTASVPVVPGETAYVGDVTLGPGGSVSGRVVDPDGRPVAGAWVGRESGDDLGGMSYGRRRRMSRWSLHEEPVGTTAADGSFTLTGVPVGEMRLWAGRERDFLATLSGPLEVRAGQESYGVEITLDRLPPEDLIAGVVLAPDGTPVPGANIRYRYGSTFGRSGSGSLTADRDGRFRIILAVPATYGLSAQDPAEKWGAVAMEDIEGGRHDIELRLPENRYAELVVRDAAGRDVPAFQAMVKTTESISDFELTQADATTPRPVRVRVPAREFDVEVEADGYDVGRTGPYDPNDVPAVIQVSLRPLPALAGRVVRDGVPTAGAAVTVHRAVKGGLRSVHNGFQNRWHPFAEQSAATTDDGSFRLTVREPGRFVVRVIADGSAPCESAPFDFEPETGRDIGTLTLVAGGSIEGRVRDASPAGTIVGISRGDGHPVSQRVGPDGRFRFDGLTPGPWEVRRLDADIVAGTSSSTTTRGTFAPAWSCEVRDGAVTRHDLGAAGVAPAQLEGRITVNGAAMRGWSVVLLTPDDRAFDSSDVVRTDADGRYRLDVSATGNYRVLVRAPDMVLIATRLTEVLIGENPLDLELVTGRLVVNGVPPVADDRPSPRHALVRESGDWMTLALLRPDADGRAVVTLAPAGASRIALHDPTNGALEPADWETVRRVTIRENAETSLDLSNPEGDGENKDNF